MTEKEKIHDIDSFKRVDGKSGASLAVPVTMEEVPDELFEIMMNLKEHV
jgi:hypothetical protein